MYINSLGEQYLKHRKELEEEWIHKKQSHSSEEIQSKTSNE